MDKGRAGIIIAVALAAAGAGAGWWYSTSGRGLDGAAAGYNVLLITMDTTRADCLGCYGHPKVKTPHIDALARDGVRFTQCMATAPITLPSHASIMTATFPFVHRARHNGRFVADEGNVTLAERLKQAGYATGAEVGAYVLDRVWGLDQGFDSYRSHKGPPDPRGRFTLGTEDQSVPADDVCDRAIEWLVQHAGHRFFLWAHFFDPHQPCEPPERFKSQYEDAYFGEIAFVDEQIGRLLAEVKRLGLEERTLVVLTSDHGEGRMEHQELTHTYFVYDSTMHVPLIWRAPKLLKAGRVVEAQVSTVDIAPTVAALVGAGGVGAIQGTSLAPLLAGKSADLGLAAYGESVAAEEDFGYARLRTLRADGWKYIHAPAPELYDLRQDPGETQNVAGRQAQRVTEMRERLEQMIAEAAAGAESDDRAVQLDAAAAARLASLGYIGGYAPPETEGEVESFRKPAGGDPKEHLAIYNGYMTARAWANAKDPAKAEAILRGLVAKEPENPALRDLLAAQFRALGRLEDSATEYRALLALRPQHARARHTLGIVLGELNRLEESAAELRQAAAAMPDFPEAHSYLALALAQLGRPDDAAEHFRTALRLDPGNEGACTGLGDLLAARKEWGECVRVLRSGYGASPQSVKIANNLAWYLATAPEAGLRNGGEAVRLAESLVERLGRDDPNVLDTLAAAYAEAGRFEEALSTIQTALDTATAGGYGEILDDLQSRRALYASGRPYRGS